MPRRESSCAFRFFCFFLPWKRKRPFFCCFDPPHLFLLLSSVLPLPLVSKKTKTKTKKTRQKNSHAASASRAEAAEAKVSAEASLISARLLQLQQQLEPEGGSNKKEREQQQGQGQGQRQRQGPPRCWPRALLRAVDAEARLRGRRCVMWDDAPGEGLSSSPRSPFCCWIRWDWERDVPLEMSGARGDGKRGQRGDSGSEAAKESGGGDNSSGGGGGSSSNGGGGADAAWWEVLSRCLGPPLVPSGSLEASRVGDWLDKHTIKVHGWGEGEEGDDFVGEEAGEEKEVPLPAAAAAAGAAADAVER